MKVNLYIRYEDLEKYHKGEKIEAATYDNKDYIFGSYNDKLLNVSVHVDELRSQERKDTYGMRSGSYTYYYIQREMITVAVRKHGNKDLISFELQ